MFLSQGQQRDFLLHSQQHTLVGQGDPNLGKKKDSKEQSSGEAVGFRTEVLTLY